MLPNLSISLLRKKAPKIRWVKNHLKGDIRAQWEIFYTYAFNTSKIMNVLPFECLLRLAGHS